MSPKKCTDKYCLEKIIEKDYSQVVHDLVTRKFGKLRRLTSKRRLKKKVANAPNHKVPETTFNTEQGFTFSSPCRQSVADGIFFTSTPLNKDSHVDSVRNGRNDNDDLLIDDDVPVYATGSQRAKKVGHVRRSLNMKNSFYHDSRNKNVERTPKNNYNEETLDEQILYLQTINKIYALEKDISELVNITQWGCQQLGYIGSVPHIVAAKKLLVANLTKDALIESIAKKYFSPPSQRINCPKGEIVVDNILVESNYIGDHERLPLCYYIIVVNHGTTVLSTNILAPDCHGKVEFPASMVFENINHDFCMKISLYKLEVLSKIVKKRWEKLFSDEPPRMELVGQKLLSNSNLNTTTVFGCSEVAYINLNYSLDTGRGPLEGKIVIRKIVRKNFRETKIVSNSVWGILRRTDLSIYNESAEEAQLLKAVDVLRMTRCKSCQPCHNTPNTIVLDMVKSHSSSLLYLSFDNDIDFQEWLRAISFAVLISKKWQY